MNKLNINQWAEEDRPREKLERLGPSVLTNAELLAILIGSGSAQESAVALMQRVLRDCHDNLNELGKCSVADLTRYHGMGPAKAIAVLAACELGKRRQREMALQLSDLGSATAIYNYMHPKMQDLDVEEFWALYMNQGCKLIKAMRIAHGGISETVADLRIILKEALLCNATVLAVCHNHPSGNIVPSVVDNRLTDSIHKACDTMRIRFLDHVIVTDGAYYSYHEEGLL